MYTKVLLVNPDTIFDDIDLMEHDPPHRGVARRNARFHPYWIQAEEKEWQGLFLCVRCADRSDWPRHRRSRNRRQGGKKKEEEQEMKEEQERGKPGSLKALKENTSPFTLTHSRNPRCSHSLWPPHP